MRRRLVPLVFLAVLAAGLTSCAAVPEPDWPVRESDANDFIQRATAETDSLGAGSFRVVAEDPQPEDDGGVTLEYESAKRVDGFSVACFGDGSIRFGYVGRTASSWTGAEATEVACDGAEIEVPFSERVDAVRFHAALVSGTGAVVAAAVSGGAE